MKISLYQKKQLEISCQIYTFSCNHSLNLVTSSFLTQYLYFLKITFIIEKFQTWKSDALYCINDVMYLYVQYTHQPTSKFVSHKLSCISPFKIISNKFGISIINHHPVNIFCLILLLMGILLLLFKSITILPVSHLNKINSNSLTSSNGQSVFIFP